MPEATNDIASRIEKIRGEIHRAETEAGRTPDSTRLIAVSKQKPASAMRDAARTGQRDFGENYVNEALPKIDALKDLDLVWHFIGAIQSNKTRQIAEHFHWVHTIDRERIAERLNGQRPEGLAPINALIQVNIDAEDSKAGVAAGGVVALADALGALPRLRLRGLMAIPKPDPDYAAQFDAFTRLARLRDSVNDRLALTPPLDTLSMGMSADMRAAIAAGATHVRIGTAIFGARN